MEELNSEKYSDFISSLIPKTHIQALDFIKSHPKYDGRNVKIAIWDTGIDPAAEGLQVTTEGKPKLTYMCDTSGCADVDMCVKANVLNGKIKLISKRTIQLPDSVKANATQVRLGLKVASDIFPKSVITQMSKEYKENVWSKDINKHILTLNEKKRMTGMGSDFRSTEPVYLLECLDILDKNYEYPIPVFECIVFYNGEEYVSIVDTSILETEKNLELKMLTNFEKHRQYLNFGGATNLNFAVNISDKGDKLEIVTCSGSHGTHVASICAANFPDNPEFNGIAPGAEVVSVKISDSRLGSMETGVSLSLAAQKTVELGCDIINMSFGEASIQSNCGQICRLMQELVRKYGIIFCSSSGNNGPSLFTVGAPGGTTDMIFGISPVVFPDTIASNYSLPPIHQTNQIKASEGDSSNLEPTSTPPPAEVYTWASRGPSTDGSWGIHVAAPGSAIASVGKFQYRSIGLMNGSSMSSPNACGGFSLLISAAKQQNKTHSPWLLQLATANTAYVMPTINRLSQGHGLLQVKNAYEFMEKYWTIASKKAESSSTNKTTEENKEDSNESKSEVNSDETKENLEDDSVIKVSDNLKKSENNSHVHFRDKKMCLLSPSTPLHRFRIKCTVGNCGARGIIIREPFETGRMRSFTVNIFPDFDTNSVNHVESVNIQLYLHLVCKASYVRYPQFFTLYNQERTMNIKIDPTKLVSDLSDMDKQESPRHLYDKDSDKKNNEGDSHSGVYTTELEFHCKEYEELGPLARLPITIFKTALFTSKKEKDDVDVKSKIHLDFRNSLTESKKVIRHFLATPDGANAMLIQLNPISATEGSNRVDVRLMSLYPNSSAISSESYRVIPSLDKKLDCSVAELIGYRLASSVPCTVELLLAQYWSSSQPAILEYSVDYHGLTCSDGNQIHMLSSDTYAKLIVESHLRNEDVSPAITLNYLVIPVKPYKDYVSHIDQAILSYENIVTLDLYYAFSNPKTGEVGIYCPALGNLLYDNDYISQLYQIYDSNDRIVGTGDYRPETKINKEAKYFFRLDKGEYRVKLQVRHFKLTQIERMKDQVIRVHIPTSSIANSNNVSFDFSRSLIDLNCNKTSGNNKLNFTLMKGEKTALYISTSSIKNLKQIIVGSYLTGSLSLYKNETLKKSVNYRFNYVFTSTTHNEPAKLNTKVNQEFYGMAMELFSGGFAGEMIRASSPDQKKPVISSDGMTRLFDVSMETLHRDKLTKFLQDWVVEIPTEQSRDFILTLMKNFNGASLSPDAKLCALRAINKHEADINNRWKQIEEISQNLIEEWDTKELVEYFGSKSPNPRFTVSREEKTKFDKQKSNLIEVLSIYGVAMSLELKAYRNYINNPQIDDSATESTGPPNVFDPVMHNLEQELEEKLDIIYSKMCRFITPWDNAIASNNTSGYRFFVAYAAVRELWGMMLKSLLKTYYEEQSNNLKTLDLICHVLERIGWKELCQHFKSLKLLKHPTAMVNSYEENADEE